MPGKASIHTKAWDKLVTKARKAGAVNPFAVATAALGRKSFKKSSRRRRRR